MPTYRNDTSAPIPVKSLSGDIVQVLPGKEVQTYDRNSSLTLLSETPKYNPTKGVETLTVTAAGNEYIDVPAGAKYFKVWRVSGSYKVSIFYQSITNSPAVAALDELDMFTGEIDGKVDRLALQFSGAMSCEVVFSSEELG